MPKKKNKKKDKQYSQAWLITLFALIIFVVIVRLVAGFIVTNRDKANFKKIDKDIYAIQSELKKSNPQMATSISRYCEERQFKFESPANFCTVKIKSADSFTKKDIIASTKNNHISILNAGFKEVKAPNFDSLFYTGAVEKSDIDANCAVSYDSSSEPRVDGQLKYYFSFYCSDQVYKFIY